MLLKKLNSFTNNTVFVLVYKRTNFCFSVPVNEIASSIGSTEIDVSRVDFRNV